MKLSSIFLIATQASAVFASGAAPLDSVSPSEKIHNHAENGSTQHAGVSGVSPDMRLTKRKGGGGAGGGGHGGGHGGGRGGAAGGATIGGARGGSKKKMR